MISIYGPINGLSYGLVTINLVNALSNLGEAIDLYPINPQNIECEPQYQDNIKKCLENAKSFNEYGPAIKIWHQWDFSIFPKNDCRIGFPIFELDQLTKLEQHNLNSLKFVFVCSKWAENVCINSNIFSQVEVIPLGVDLNIFNNTNIRKNNKTIFLNVGKWEKRKGHDILSQAFNAAFEEKDKVELWMMPSNPFLSPEKTAEWENLYKNSKLFSKIRFLPRQNSQNELQYIYNSANFGVFPSRAEGWNLPALESMACGTIPIITNYSAHTEFCNNENSLLIEGNEVEPAIDNQWFVPGNQVNNGNWFKFGDSQMEQLIENFRTAHRLNIEKSTKLDEMRNKCLETGKKFTWENSAKSIISAISTYA